MTREEAINQLQDAKYGYQEYLSAEAIEMAIKALEQEPRKAHWIGDYCSCCGEDSYPYDLNGYGSYYVNYCPNCGADMREDKE